MAFGFTMPSRLALIAEIEAQVTFAYGVFGIVDIVFVL